MHARLRAHITMYSHVCPPDDFCIAPDTIAYAKVSGADSIAWRTQLHLTPVPLDGFTPDLVRLYKCCAIIIIYLKVCSLFIYFLLAVPDLSLLLCQNF